MALDHDLNHMGNKSDSNNPNVKLFQDFIDKFDNEHPSDVVWT